MKSPFQTAAEKMADAELTALHTLVTDRTKGAAARLWVIESMLTHQMQERGVTPPLCRRHKPRSVTSMSVAS